jgi:GNAT superfamily N-acetyltransferase
MEDYEAAEHLLDTARNWLIKRGLKKMIGPTNFSSNDECGIMIEGFDSLPSLGVPYTHRAYPEFFERFGLTKVKDLLVWTIDLSRPLPERMQRIASRIEARGALRLRRVNPNAYEREREALKDVLLSAPVQGWGELPWTEEEYYARADDLRYLIIPDLFLIVEHSERPVAFAISVPDYGPILNRVSSPFGFIKWMRFRKLSRMINRFRMFSLQIHRDYQRRGIETLLYMETIRTAKRLGYQHAMVLVPEDYTITRQITELGGKVEKRLRIYGYSLLSIEHTVSNSSVRKQFLPFP